MSDLPPYLPTSTELRPQLLDGRTWKIILAPLVLLALTAICGSVRNLNGVVIPLIFATGIAMVGASVWAACILAQKRGTSSASRLGWGVLAFVVLVIFYIGCAVAGCTAAVITQ